MTAERAQRAYASAERRLAGACAIAADKSKAAAIVKRDEALERRAMAAAEFARLAGLCAEQVRTYDAQAGPLSEAAAAGVAARVFHLGGAQVLRHALEHAGALESRWIGDKAQQPGPSSSASSSAAQC
jgi:hypothetical protein